ncbi:MAG: MFS transporter [Pseudomonadota bacterium]
MKRDQAIAFAALLVAALFYLFEFVARIEPSLSARGISDDLELSNAGFGLFSSVFFWIYAPMQIVVGILLDRYGVRRMVLPAILVCASGVLITGFSESAYVAILGRLLTGLGASFAFVGALYVVNHLFSPDRFAVLSGIVNALGMIGTAVGAVLLVQVIESIGWRTTFVATSVVGAALFVLAWLVLPKPQASDCNTAQTPILLPVLEVASSRSVWLIGVIGSLMYVPVNVFGGLWGNAELLADHHLSTVGAETAVSMIFWGMAVGSVGAGALSDRLGHRKWIICLASWAAVPVWLAILLSPTQSITVLSALLFVAGVLGGAQMLTFAAAKDGQDAAHVGTVVAFVNMIGIGSALIFQPLVGGLLDATAQDYATALSVLPICLGVAGALAFFISEGAKQDSSERE